ncbi:Gfo/Idh/MocA family oxidoreductase [Candidatus Pelagibacter sp.]|nr:Gfo/Idh/MocA family oxidoreductase [Candidatus Pelagibacter sp.]
MTKSCVLIGLGQIGINYDYDRVDGSLIFTHARAIDKHPEFKLVGAVDISKEQRARFKKQYKLPTFNDPEFAVQKLQPDLVVIATPTESHCSILTKVINACRPKLVLCEKPLAYELKEANKMVEMCKKAGVDLFVNYMRRVDQGVLEIKRWIDNGKIKTPVKANVWYSKGIYNSGSHFINLLSLWLGNIISTKIINPNHLSKNHDPEPDFEVQFNLGTAVFRAAWEDAFSHYSIELLSRSGRLLYDKGGELIKWQGTTVDPRISGYRILDKQKEIINNSMDIYQWHVYDYIHKHLKGEVTTLCTGLEAIETLESINLLIKDG